MSFHNFLLNSCIVLFLFSNSHVLASSHSAAASAVRAVIQSHPTATPAPVLEHSKLQRRNETGEPDVINPFDDSWLSMQRSILSALATAAPQVTSTAASGPTFTHDCHLCSYAGMEDIECALNTIDGCTLSSTTTSETTSETTTSETSTTSTDPPSATPTADVVMGLNSINIGDSHNRNDGSDLRNNVFNGLKSLCPDDAQACDHENPFVMSEIETVIDGKPAYIEVGFIIQASSYTNTTQRDRMIAMAASAWEQAAGRSCSQIQYTSVSNPETGTCNENGPAKRSTISNPLEKRVMCPPDGCLPPPENCEYTTWICAAPSLMSKDFPILINSMQEPTNRKQPSRYQMEMIRTPIILMLRFRCTLRRMAIRSMNSSAKKSAQRLRGT
jgi:hypothetical protein